MVCRGICWPVLHLVMYPNFKYHSTTTKWNNQRLSTFLAALCSFASGTSSNKNMGRFPMAKSPTASSRGAQVMFDYPTVADLTDFIVAQFSEGDDDAEGALGGD